MLNSYSRIPQTFAAGSLSRQYSLKFLLVRGISDNCQREQNDGPPPSSKHSKLLGRALAPYVAKSSADLARELIKNVIMHVVGDILVVEKPYGVSSLGYIEKGHGIFGYSRDVLKERESPEYNKRHVKEPTLSDAIPHLKEHFQEPGLHFCMGLKRWVSGPVILPCNPTAHKRIEHSLFQGSSIAHTTLEREAQHLYRALAICISRPKSDRGTVNGYAFLQKTEKAVEYIFAEGEINKRARRGNFAAQGEITYEVLESNYGCSLVDLQFSKFSMHFPRVFLSYMGAPILGDDIYMRRLLQIDGRPTLIEPKDVGRGGSKYEPTEFLRLIGLNRLDQLKPNPPMFLAVYRTTLPFYGDTKPQRRVNELELTTPPPEYFLAMTDLLNFTPAVERLLHSLDQQEENNSDADAETKTGEKNVNRKKKKKIKNVIDYSIK